VSKETYFSVKRDLLLLEYLQEALAAVFGTQILHFLNTR